MIITIKYKKSSKTVGNWVAHWKNLHSEWLLNCRKEVKFGALLVIVIKTSHAVSFNFI